MSQSNVSEVSQKERSSINLPLKVFSSITILLLAFFAGTFLFSTPSTQASETISPDQSSEFFARASESSNSEKTKTNSVTDNESDASPRFQSLLAQSGSANTDNPSSNNQCNFITDYLRIDRNNDQEQVLRLQAFLKAYQYDYVTLNGSFDEKTLRAVRAFQARHAEDILAPWGYEQDEATGYVYVTTKKKINEIYCNQELELNSNETAEIQQFRDKLTRWRQQGASFETPEYLRQFNPQLASRTAPDISTINQGSVASNEERLAQTGEDVSDDASGDQGQDQDQQVTTTTASDEATSSPEEAAQDESGFFDRLFGGSDNESSTTSDNTEQDGDRATTTTTTQPNQSGVATSLDNAATSVYSGVNSVVGFILSPTFLLILLGLLILLLIATLLEGEEGPDEEEGKRNEFDPNSNDDGPDQENSSTSTSDGNESGDDSDTQDQADASSREDPFVASDEAKTRSADFEENSVEEEGNASKSDSEKSNSEEKTS